MDSPIGSQGVGLTLAAQFNARLLDRTYKRLKEKNGGVGQPEFRLREYSNSPLSYF